MGATSDNPQRSSIELMRLFLADRGDADLARSLAERAVASLPVVDGLRMLDLGCGPGLYARELEAAGATVTALELSADELRRGQPAPARPVLADGAQLPFADGSFDAVLCSNMLEHTPRPIQVLDEIGRVLRVGGWSYISWTNWLSPWGGHAIAPLHYLGAVRGESVYRRLFGAPKGKNLPYNGVWPLHIRDVLAHLESRDALTIEAVEPRYYPWLRPIMRVPGAREILAWNCVVRIRRAH